MPKISKASYYPQPRPGFGFQFTSSRGTTTVCAGVEWYINYRSEDGKRRRHKAHTGLCRCPPSKYGVCPHERAAQEVLKEFLGGVSLSSQFKTYSLEADLQRQETSVTIVRKVDEYISYIEESRQHSNSYATSLRATLKHFVEWAVANNIHYVQDVGVHVAVAYSLFVQSENIADPGQLPRLRKHNTVNRYLREVRSLFYLLVDDGIMEENPFRKRRHSRKIFLRVTDERPITIFTDDELQLLLSLDQNALQKIVNNYAGVLHDMIRLFYRTGMRLGEMCNLTFEQVRQSKVFIEPHHDWKPKWGIKRSVPIDTSIVDLIDKRQTAQPGSEYVFITSTGTPYEEHNVYHAFNRLFKKLKIKGDTHDGVSPHTFRRTFCTHCLASGISAMIVKDWMGHSKIEMTMKYYAKIPSKTDRYIEQVNFISPGDVTLAAPTVEKPEVIL